jgi:hypothetical protein
LTFPGKFPIFTLVELEEGIDPSLGMMATVLGLRIPAIIIEDEHGPFPSQPPREFSIQKRIVGFVRAIDIDPIEARLGDRHFFYEDIYEPRDAELVLDAKATPYEC